MASVGFTLTVQVTTFLFLAWLTYKIWRGRNWARITFLALYLVGLPFSIPTVRGLFSASVTVGCITVLQTILQLAAIYLLFAKPGSNWFKRDFAVA
jgi:hypothetical protein